MASQRRVPTSEGLQITGLVPGITVLGFALLVVVLGALTGADGTATGRGLAVFGLLAFMAGAVWLGWTVLKKEPLTTWPYGLGLVAVSGAGLLVLVAGSVYPVGSPADDASDSSAAVNSAPQTGTQEPAPDQDRVSETRDQIADLRLQLAENERRISELESLLGKVNLPETGQPPGNGDASIALVGPVIAEAEADTLAAVEFVLFSVINRSETTAVKLSPTDTKVTYTDGNQGASLSHTATVGSDPGWYGDFSADSGGSLEPGQQVQITLNLTGLISPLTGGTLFVVEVRPGGLGPPLMPERTVPSVLTSTMELE